MADTDLENQIDTSTTFDPADPANDAAAPTEDVVDQPAQDADTVDAVEPAPVEPDPRDTEIAELRQQAQRLLGIVERGSQQPQAPQATTVQDGGILEAAKKFFDDDTAQRLSGFLERYEADRLGKRFVPAETFKQYEGAMHHMGLTMAEQQSQAEFVGMGYKPAEVQDALKRVRLAAQNGENVGNTRRAVASELTLMQADAKKKAATAQNQARVRKVEQRPKADMRGINANATGPALSITQEQADKQTDREFMAEMKRKYPSAKGA